MKNGQAGALPIDALLPEIVDALRTTQNLVIEAAPGAGKTTRVPPALLALSAGEIIVLEPRRIAARMAARRVAAEMGEALGETVGYQVRFESIAGPRTRLRFVTEGVLTRRLITDPVLRGVDTVVLDEFHERHLDTDLALALLVRLQKTRPELRIVVMSATLDAAPIAAFLNHCPIVTSTGKVFPVQIEYTAYSAHPLPVQVRDAVAKLQRQGTGHTLVFLPGAAEIRRTMRECEEIARSAGMLMLPLSGDLSPAEQDRAVAPSVQPKLILSTNVAESSVTIDGVTAVIDSGLARIASHSRWTGLPTLNVTRISKASANQRAGRAGRTAPGRVVRMYAEADFRQRPDQNLPEILRGDLAQMCLTLRASGLPSALELEWLDAPPTEALLLAETLLDRLGASGKRAIELARLPLPPRLAALVLAAKQSDIAISGCLAAALLSSGTRYLSSDLLTAMEGPQSAAVQQTAGQLRHIVNAGKSSRHDDEALLKAALAGFPDRVARCRSGAEAQLANGISAEMTGGPLASEFLVALDVEDRSDKAMPQVRMTCRIEPDWLIDLFPEAVREERMTIWNANKERVEAYEALLYEQIVLQQWSVLPRQLDAAEMLAQKATEIGVERFIDPGALKEMLARIEFAGLPSPDLEGVLRQLCDGLRSFEELRAAASANLLPLLEQAAGPARLRELAPATLRLQGGRQVPVHYESGKPPWIESRLQDFFGMNETPGVGPNRIPVVVHLLAPNRRAVQTTTDLAGFWERLYPQVRRELMRRYPRHAWPERP